MSNIRHSTSVVTNELHSNTDKLKTFYRKGKSNILIIKRTYSIGPKMNITAIKLALPRDSVYETETTKPQRQISCDEFSRFML